MINILKDLTVNSMIGMLPSVVNYNNESIRGDFDYIFDYDKGCYYHDLINPTGIVKAHWGEFVNLTVDTIRVKDPSTLFNSTFKNISHNLWADRFVNPDNISDSDKEKYAHDIASIKGLEERLHALENAVNEYKSIYKLLTTTNIDDNVYPNSGQWTTPEFNEGENSSNALNPEQREPSDVSIHGQLGNDSSLIGPSDSIYGSNIYGASRTISNDKEYVMENGNATEYTYPKSLMTEPQSTIKKESRYQGDYRDLQACKTYHYIDINKTDIDYILIKNNCQYALNNAKTGHTVYLILDAQNSDQEFIIKLTGCSNEHMHINPNTEDTEIPLVCFKNDRTLGSCWKLQEGYESSDIEIK